MKRLALLLGSLLVVSAAASAKEVVPAPVVVEEAPVQIIEKEVIVYRDKEEGFRPNGYVDLQYKYMGDTEGKQAEWNGANNYSRTQLQGAINMTENQKFEFRIRDYNSLDHNPEKAGSNGNGTDTRLRYYYDHGTLGDSKIDMTSFVEYRKRGDKSSQSQKVEYQLKFDFAEYMFDNDYVKTTEFTVGPRYIYSWNKTNDSAYTNSLGFYVNFVNELPYGFSTQLEIDGLHYNMYGDGARVADGSATNLKDDSLSANVGLYLYHNANLYTNGAYSLDWYFEGGYDTYDWSNRDSVTPTYEESAYSLYAQPNLILSYKATEFVTLYGDLGAEYRNWNVTAKSEAQDWRWQPFVAVGFNVAF